MGKKRDRRISLAEHRLLMKELRDIASDCGFEVVVYRRSAFSHKEYFRCAAGGYCDHDHGRIVVTVYGRPARRQILYVIAHEVRHAMHYRDGLYKSYYKHGSKELKEAWDSPSKIKKIHLNMGVAQRAEQNCNDWADQWLISHGIKPYNEKYSSYETLASRVNQRKLQFRRMKNGN